MCRLSAHLCSTFEKEAYTYMYIEKIMRTCTIAYDDPKTPVVTTPLANKLQTFARWQLARALLVHASVLHLTPSGHTCNKNVLRASLCLLSVTVPPSLTAIYSMEQWASFPEILSIVVECKRKSGMNHDSELCMR